MPLEELQESEVAVKTIFLRCAALHSRGELVNRFLFLHRAKIGIHDWYTEDGLDFRAPLEIAYVKNSKKPFFLIEVRSPLQEELDRRKTVLQSENVPNSGIEVKNEVDSLVVPPSKLEEVSKALLSLKETDKEYKGEPVIISLASNNISVREERKRGEDRESKRKRNRAPQHEQPLKKEKNSLSSFVPRSVRRRV